MLVIFVAALLLGAGVATWKSPRLTSALLWSLVTTTFITAALLLVLPGAFSDKALWIALSVPIIWVGFQYWCYYANSAWLVVITQISISIAGGITVFLSNPQI